MPKVKSDKRSEGKEGDSTKPYPTEKSSGGWGGGGQLFGRGTTETSFQGAGFKDKDKAMETLKLLEGRDVSFQFQIINSMFHRAKVILKRTKDEEKVKNLTEAVETFEEWLNDYKAHGRSKENFSYLPLETVEAYKPLADRYGLKEENLRFMEIYKQAGGDLKKVRMKKVDPDDEKSLTWDVVRNKNLREISEKIKKEYLPMYETDVELKGLPTKDHVEMILWAYSPDVTKIKKAIATFDEKLKSSDSS